ncbi:MAG: hypothetical protein IJZ77_04105 [Bacilli bacterium]|nr:hypothetical protein [Bacilli bacterium]
MKKLYSVNFTIAYDSNVKIVYASCTNSGYGLPDSTDYCDVVIDVWGGCNPGETISIFLLGDNYKTWGKAFEDGTIDTKVEHNGELVPQWEDYTVVVPNGGAIVTGTAEVMLPIVNSIFGLELTVLENNSLLALGNGSYNNVVVTAK